MATRERGVNVGERGTSTFTALTTSPGDLCGPPVNVVNVFGAAGGQEAAVRARGLMEDNPCDDGAENVHHVHQVHRQDRDSRHGRRLTTDDTKVRI